ncbi:unnamed protein product [Alopecurus aequalis]
MGRGKVEMRRIENKAKRQVTFSKRRGGLLKKAHELAVLCDAHLGVVIFSCTGKLFEYCSPHTRAPVSLHSKIQRYGSVTNDQLQGTDHDDDQVQQMLTEMARLRRECNQLETSIRRHNGEDLSPLSEEELGNLQKQFESALGKVRERKDTLLKQQLDESRHRDELLNQQLGESRRRVRNLEEHGNFLRQMINENGHHRAAAEAPVVAAGGMPLPAKAFGGFFPWLEMAGSTSQQLPDF